MERPRAGKFSPKEVLFASTDACNLRCAHCSVEPGSARLSIPAAVKFLRSCHKVGVERVGFTGGEPFLDTEFLFALTEDAVAHSLLFGMITTNARWFKSPARLRRTLKELRDRGYDGSFGVSVDAFHGKDPGKPALFIETAVGIWNRPDIARVIAVRGARDKDTGAVLRALAKALKAKFVRMGGHGVIRNDSLFVPVTAIELVPVGKAERFLDPWGKDWFQEDFCRGPGHVFYVLPDGSVKPCCGYATGSERLTIGNIHKDSAAKMLENAARNPFVSTVYREGLTGIRKRLTKRGVVFPGATKNQCYFCHHLLTRVSPIHLGATVHGSISRGPGKIAGPFSTLLTCPVFGVRLTSFCLGKKAKRIGPIGFSSKINIQAPRLALMARLSRAKTLADAL